MDVKKKNIENQFFKENIQKKFQVDQLYRVCQKMIKKTTNKKTILKKVHKKKKSNKRNFEKSIKPCGSSH
jgi:hypothetical protein